jgi:predicted Zn-dependent protease
MSTIRFFIVLGLLAAGSALATLGTPDPDVSLASVLDLWSDTLRDTDQIGMRLTRVSDTEEMNIGEELTPSLASFGRADAAAASYVTDVAALLLPNVRRHGIRYQFHVVESPEINAFSLPGGHVFVTTSMLKFVESEAELAAVLGHEISHIDARHCIERFQYEYMLKKAGLPEAGWILETAHSLATMSFASYQELEADAQGERMTIEAGYDPDAAATMFARMQKQFHEPSRAHATTPAGEVAQATGQALGSFFRSHPPSEERSRRLHAMAAQHSNGRFYVGKRNLLDHVARVRREDPAEFR